jgi:regulator of RNase E activity RraA
MRVGVPIRILGAEIKPADLLHGDENGLLRIPAGALAGLPPAVDGARARAPP